ncbi:XRE family transcriptional regulator [Pantoea endophytica]|uniref:S24 family peptidase n=1 Tax=Pantoea sp. BJ2 TaxID=3141322 RepID=A0AAU7U3V8_9GAMM
MEIENHDEVTRKVFSQRLTLACDNAGIKIQGRQAQIASALKVSPRAVSKWFNAESIPRRIKLLKLAGYVGADLNWLLGADDKNMSNTGLPEFRTPECCRVEILDVAPLSGAKMVPTPHVDAGIRALEFTPEHAEILFGKHEPKAVRFLIVNGDGMSPTLDTGDLVYLDTRITQFTTDGIYAFFFADTLHIKRLQMKKDRLLVLSDNPLYREWYIDNDDVTLFTPLGKVILKQRIDITRL